MKIQCPHCQNWTEYKNGKCPHCKEDLFDDLNVAPMANHNPPDSDAISMDGELINVIPESNESNQPPKAPPKKSLLIKNILKKSAHFLKKLAKWFGILCAIYIAGVLLLSMANSKFMEYGLIRPIDHIINYIKYGDLDQYSHKEFNGKSWDYISILHESDNCKWYAESWPIPTNFDDYDIESMANRLYKKHDWASALETCNWTPKVENEPNLFFANPYKYVANEPGCILTNREAGTVLWLRKQLTDAENGCDPNEQRCSEMIFSMKIDFIANAPNDSDSNKAFFRNPPFLMFGFNDDLHIFTYHQNSQQNELHYSYHENRIDITDRITENNDQRIEFKLDDELTNLLKRKKRIHVVFLVEIPGDGFTSRYLVYQAFSLYEAQKRCLNTFEKI